MWFRGTLKKQAKNCLSYYYGSAFLVTILAGLLFGMGESGSILLERIELHSINQILFLNSILIVLSFIVGNVVMVGSCRFFMESRVRKRSVGLGALFYGFKEGRYLNVAKVMFMNDLFVVLWSCLLIIPGIIKSYEYYMVPYILSENPDMPYKEVLAMSRRMMEGSKFNAFVLDWSYFGWLILIAIFCYPFGTLFLEPYIHATRAELYAELRSNYGITGLNGFGGEAGVIWD